MAPFDYADNLPANSLKILELIAADDGDERVRKTLSVLKSSEPAFIISALQSVEADDKWVQDPVAFETLMFYYAGMLRTVKAFTDEIYANGGFTPQARAHWSRTHKALLRERTLHRLDSVVKPNMDSELRVLALIFENANKPLFDAISLSKAGYTTMAEREIIAQAGQGEVFLSLFGGMRTPLGSALGYLMQQALSGEKMDLEIVDVNA